MQSLLGIWSLVEARAFDDTGRELPPPLGPQPMGIVSFGADRMVGAIGDGRSSVNLGEPPRCFFAYTGTYRFDGAVLVTLADDASKPELIVEQVRRVRFDSPDRITLIPVSGLPGYSGINVLWERIG